MLERRQYGCDSTHRAEAKQAISRRHATSRRVTPHHTRGISTYRMTLGRGRACRGRQPPGSSPPSEPRRPRSDPPCCSPCPRRHRHRAPPSHRSCVCAWCRTKRKRGGGGQRLAIRRTRGSSSGDNGGRNKYSHSGGSHGGRLRTRAIHEQRAGMFARVQPATWLSCQQSMHGARAARSGTHVSTMILRPVRPASPWGPPMTKRPEGFRWYLLNVNICMCVLM